LNKILNEQRTELSYHECFGNDGKKITDKNDIANGFNTFFANI